MMLCPLCFALFMGLPFTCHVVIMPFIHIFIIVVPFSCLTLLFRPPLMFHMTNTLLLHLHCCYTLLSHYCSTFPSCFMCLPHPPLHFACLLCLSYVFHVLDLPFFCLSCFMLLFSYPSHFTLLLSRTLYFMLLLLCPLQFAFLSCLLRFMLLLSCPLNLC